MRGQVRLCALRSGSSGNAIFLGNRETRLLIDAGICARSVEQSLAEIDESASDLDALLVTHEHSDHIAGIGVMMRRYRLPLYVNSATWLAMQKTIGKVDPELVHLISPGEQLAIGDFAVTSFSTPHDAVDPVGYRVETDRGVFAVLTDLGHAETQLLQHVAGSLAVLIEANYDPMMLMAGKYPYFLKQRISGGQGHLSNEDCGRAMIQLIKWGTKHFQLAHLSKDNNYPELAMLTVEQMLAETGAKTGLDYTLSIARRYAVSQPCQF